MRLTIIPVDSAVYKNDTAYSELDLSNCGIPSNVHALQWNNNSGWIEFIGADENQQISELPGWAVNCVSVWDDKEYEIKNPPSPTPEEIILANESKAKALLANSDWTQLPDVNLENQADWVSYRQNLRAIATAPTIDPVWPTEPQIIWS